MYVGSWLKWFWSAAGLLVAPALLMGATAQCKMCPPTPACDTSSSSSEASTLLQEMRSKAIQVRDLADQLGAFERDGAVIDWRADGAILTRAKFQVNAMDQMLFRLRAMRQDALPWQQKAIDRVAPKLIELTDFVQAAIQNLNTHHSTVNLLDNSYAQDTNSMFQRASTIAHSIGQYEEYAAARNEVRQLSPKLGMRATS